MKRFLKVILACILLVVLAPTVWSIITHQTDHDDVFDRQNLLEASAADLKTTCVSPHLECPIKEGASVVWCGTFQLVWNEACTLVGEDLHFAGNEPPMVAILNKKAFLKSDLDEASYVALADFVRNDVYAQIPAELERKFHGRATPKYLPPRHFPSRPQDIVAYAYLFKNLEFPVLFERLDQPLVFGQTRVASFGIGEDFKPGQVPMYGQVLVLDYQNPDDFMIELRTKAQGDRVILAKMRPSNTLKETILAAHDRMARAKPVPAVAGDVLKVPKLNFDITRRYDELLGSELTVKNRAIEKGLVVLDALQNIRFQMDEKGVRLRSEAHMVLGCGVRRPPPRNRLMLFDKPFLLMLERSDAKMPYLALWIGDAEILERVDRPNSE